MPLLSSLLLHGFLAASYFLNLSVCVSSATNIVILRLGSPFLYFQKCLQPEIQGNCRDHLIFFSFLSKITGQCCLLSNVRKQSFHVFCPVVCSRRASPVPITLLVSRNKSPGFFFTLYSTSPISLPK